MQVRELKTKKRKKRRVGPISKIRSGYGERKKLSFDFGCFRFYAFIISCIVFAIASVGQYCKVVTTNIELVNQEERVSELKMEYQDLKMTAARLNSLVRIEHIARNELAMEEAEEVRIFTASRD